MTFEDDLRSVMKDHDRDAPTGLRFDPSRHARTRLWAPLAAAAAIVLLAAGLIVVVGGKRNDAAGGVSCPDQYKLDGSPAGWVPGPPRLPGAERQLVPNQVPTAVVVCSFERDDGGRGRQAVALSGTRRVDGDLSAVRDYLRSQPRKGGSALCTADIKPTDGENYLIGLRYRGGVVWVAAPGNHCSGSSNGEFESATNLRTYAHGLQLTGRVVPPPRPRTCPVTDGRAGDDKSLVPAGVLSADLCVGDGANAKAEFKRVLRGAVLDNLLRRVDALKAVSGTGCKYLRGQKRTTYHLIFNYRSGSSVELIVWPQCRPNVQGRVLQADGPESFLAYLRSL